MSQGTLGPVEALDTMRIWHTNVENTPAIHKSSAPIPNSHNPRPTNLPMESEEWLDVVDPPPVTIARRKRKGVRRKRKPRNDSVSVFSPFRYSIQF